MRRARSYRSEKKMDFMYMLALYMSPVVMHVDVNGQRFKQTNLFTHVGGVITEYPDG